MKNIILYFSFLFFPLCPASAQGEWKNWEGLEKSIIQEDFLHIIMPKEDDLKSYSLKKKSSPFYNFMLSVTYPNEYYFFPYCWELDFGNLTAYPLGASEGRNGSRTFFIRNTSLVRYDSTERQVVSDVFYNSLKDSLQKFYGDNYKNQYALVMEKKYQEDIKKANARQLEPFYPLFKAIQMEECLMKYDQRVKKGFINPRAPRPSYAEAYEDFRLRDKIQMPNATFDYIRMDDSTCYFYLRDEYRLTVWKYHYPPVGVESRESDWQEIRGYAGDTVRNYQQITTSPYLPTSDKTIIDSVSDSLFFRGHFHAFRQGDDFFILNLHYGGLYYLGAKSIDKIGQIDIQNYPVWLLGRKGFIQDRDSGEVVFFSRMERTDSTLPFPKIKEVTDEKQYHELFGQWLDGDE